MTIASAASVTAPGLDPRLGANAAGVATTNAGDVGASAASAFQALLAPALAGKPEVAVSPALARGVEATAAALTEPVEGDPLAADERAPESTAAAATGNNLPLPAGIALLIPGLAVAAAATGRAPATAARSPVAIGAAGVADAAVRERVVGEPVPTAAGATPALLETDADLVLASAAADAYLERFTSAPHRLPATPVAGLGFAGSGDDLPLDTIKAGAVDGDASGLAALPAAAPRVAAGAAPVLATPDAPSPGFRDSPGSTQWQRALDDQVLLMVSKGSQHARIRLHPQEMGQLDIRIAVGNDRVELNFSVQHAAVAAAVTQHLPHLAQLFAEQGLAMGQASVSQQQSHPGGQPGDGGSQPPPGRAWGEAGDDMVAAPAAWEARPRSLFDAFA